MAYWPLYFLSVFFAYRVIFPLIVILFQYTVGIKLFSKRKLLRKAGEWAIITGSTSGIGKAYAEELASDGLNIMLISRNSESLKTFSEELIATYGVQVKWIDVDFTHIDIYDRIKDQIDSLPSIACLVNNVSMVNRYPEDFSFDDGMCVENIERFIACNCISVASMTHIVLPRLIAQNSGAALINLSSYSGVRSMPYISLYGATKAFTCHLSRSLAVEVSHKNVLIQTIYPMYVATAMVGGKRGFFVISPRTCAKTSLDMLGVSSFCVGHLRHALQVLYYQNLPQSFINKDMEDKLKRGQLRRMKNK